VSELLTIAVIPARGGSKRIPRKNIRPFLGIPLIARPIGTLLVSGIFDHIVVSTDDDEIAEIAEAAGAWVPFRRAPELAGDHTPTVPVVVDAIERVETLTGGLVGEVLVVYPAAVFMTVEHVSAARSILHETGADVVMSAAEFPAPILRSWRRNPDGCAEMIWPEHRLTRSQDLEPTYYDAGQFYWWGNHHKLTGQAIHTTALFMLNQIEVQDIDTADDWNTAELKFQLNRSTESVSSSKEGDCRGAGAGSDQPRLHCGDHKPTLGC
jgi:pseudaminic acid cytidylyltransferase